jgi:dihydroorotate dehydrogenase
LALQNELPIIAAGGVFDGRQARAKLDAGAKLVQIYSGLIYRGPALVRVQPCHRRNQIDYA